MQYEYINPVTRDAGKRCGYQFDPRQEAWIVGYRYRHLGNRVVWSSSPPLTPSPGTVCYLAPLGHP